jgi:3-(3-hydroxy-phenyl)propionate hydroxylase
VLRWQANPAILDSYHQERQPHAREIIGMALLMGRLVMPANRVKAFLIHGFMSLIRLVPAGRALFEDLKIKPQNTFKTGLFTRVKASKKLLAGSTFPQSFVRKVDTGEILLSDDVLGPCLTLVGFGVDATALVPPDVLDHWARLGGACLQWCHRGQTLAVGKAIQGVEALDDSLLPRRVPLGWTLIVRPDRTILCEGPLESVSRMLMEATRMLTAAAH